MPDYEVSDPVTGKTLVVSGDSPPTEAELTQIFSQFKPMTPKTEAAPSAPSGPKPWSLDMLAQSARTTSDPAVGALKGVANTVIGAGELVYDYLPGVSTVSDAVAGGNAKPMFSAARRMVQPSNTMQKIGFIGEQIGEFFLPGPTGAKGKVTKTAFEAVKAGGLTQLQTADPTSSGVSAGITAVMPVAGKVTSAVAPMLRKSAEKSMAQALGATKEVMKSEAAELAPEMLARGIKGSRQALLDRATVTSKEVGKRLGALYKEAGEAGQTIPGLVVRGELELARNGLMVPNRAGVMVPVYGAEKVVKRLDKLAAWVETLGDDIPAHHASKIKTIWDQIVAKSGLYGPKAAANATDSAEAWTIREGAGSFRQLLNDVNTDIQVLNREYAFWKGMKNVLKATELRTQAQSGRGLTATIGAATGFASGDDMTDRLASAAAGAAGGAYLVKAMQSAPFRTRVSGPFKDMMARALASGNDSEVLSAIKKIVSTLPAQARPALSQ